MSLNIPSAWLYMTGACMVAILAVQLADAARVPKWVQWAVAAACILVAWASSR